MQNPGDPMIDGGSQSAPTCSFCLGSRTREQPWRFGSELPSVQGQVGAIQWRYPRGSRTPRVAAVDKH